MGLYKLVFSSPLVEALYFGYLMFPSRPFSSTCPLSACIPDRIIKREGRTKCYISVQFVILFI